jgi:protein-tyrosine-phosphatase
MSVSHLITLIAAWALQAPARPAPAVVFVCEHGAAKSVIATAYFNKLAAERNLPYRATFRGTSPQDELSVRAVDGLKADGITVPSGKPSAITDADVAGATHIFAIGCTLPDTARRSGKSADWSDVPDDQGYGPMRDAIVRHVTQVLNELAGQPSRAGSNAVRFVAADIGKAPGGWTATQTGTGDAKWTVVRDDTAPGGPFVLKQSGQATFPLCLKDDTNLLDGFVEVKFKPISGTQDQAGGVVWRAKDANNYYIARANALENNVTIYHTINGRRTEKKRVQAPVAANQWHTLLVEFRGNHFTVMFNGQKALDWDDETFKEPGKVGVWTKADSVTEFSGFNYGPQR